MSVIALDLGGTKLASGLFSADGELLKRSTELLPAERGPAVGRMIADRALRLLEDHPKADAVSGVGICVPGIYRSQSRTVWAPNIPGWEDYPLWEEVKQVVGDLEVYIDSDRACCILGEAWRGAARDCSDAIFVTVGTGIGAGILTGDRVLRGAQDIAGAIGWMALQGPYRSEYDQCGCYEHHASGEGIAKGARSILRANPAYAGPLAALPTESICASDVFAAYHTGEPVARQVMEQVIRFWGMATANLISIFNPEKVVYGGGVFGPAAAFIRQIREEAGRWAQPISMQHVKLELSQLGADAGLYGAASLVLQSKRP